MSRKKGYYYEQKAKHYLTSLLVHPHTVLHENFTCRMGEIDLITQSQNTLHFVEVKYRRSEYFMHPLESITYTKQRKLTKTALFYLQTHPHYQKMTSQFDVICITNAELEWFPNAF